MRRSARMGGARAGLGAGGGALVAAFGALALAACDGEQPASVADPAVAPEPIAAPPPGVEAAAPVGVDDKAARYGKVLEVVPASGGYTYARVDACGMDAWIAAPPTELTVGSLIEMPIGTVMTNFDSPTLNRKFDAILFVNWVRPSTTEPDCSAPPPQQAPPGQPGVAGAAGTSSPWATSKMSSGHGSAGGAAATGPATADEVAGKVAETMNSGGYTYARLEGCGGRSTWVAGPQSNVAVGQALAAGGGVPMAAFHSNTLDRTFDSILFAQSLRVLSEPPRCN